MKKTLLILTALLLALTMEAKQTVVYKGEFATGNWATSLSLNKSAFANLTAGDILFVGWTKDEAGATAASETWYQVTVADGNWHNDLINSYNGAHVFCYVHTLTAAEVLNFQTNGMIVGGHFINVNYVGFFNASDASEVQYWSSTDWTDAATNNLVFPTGWGSAALNNNDLKNLEIGDILTIDFTHADGIGEWDAQLQITLAHPTDPWTPFIDVPVGLTNSISLVVDAGNITNLTTGDVRPNGKDVTITHIRTLKSATKCYQLSVGGTAVTELPTTTPIDIELIRKFDWQTTICLPFDVDNLSVFGHSAKAYEFKEYTAADGLKFTERSKIKAGVPYLMTFDMSGMVEAEKTYAVTFNNVTVNTTITNSAASGGLTFKGNYTPNFNMEDKYGVACVQHGENWDWGFYKGGTNTKLNAFSAYIDGTPATSQLAINLDDDETTSIDNVISKMSEVRGDVFFDLQGRRITNPTKGLYIVNGKKVIIK